jgi:dUTP pyrophosphatase
MLPQPQVRLKRLRTETDADIPLPRYMSPQAAGLDLFAAVADKITIAPTGIALIPTGFAMALPEGYEAQIRPRSGLAVTHGIGIVNAPGTIDADYRGEIKVALINWSNQAFEVIRGTRIAQMIIAPVARAHLLEVDRLEPTARADGGFGHTGV